MSQSQKTIKSTFLLLTELSRSKTEKVARLRRLAVDVGEEKAEEGKRHGVGAGPTDGSVGRSENGRAWTALIIGSDFDDLQGSENRIEAKRAKGPIPIRRKTSNSDTYPMCSGRCFHPQVIARCTFKSGLSQEDKVAI